MPNQAITWRRARDRRGLTNPLLVAQAEVSEDVMLMCRVVLDPSEFMFGSGSPVEITVWEYEHGTDRWRQVASTDEADDCRKIHAIMHMHTWPRQLVPGLAWYKKAGTKADPTLQAIVDYWLESPAMHAASAA